MQANCLVSALCPILQRPMVEIMKRTSFGRSQCGTDQSKDVDWVGWPVYYAALSVCRRN